MIVFWDGTKIVKDFSFYKNKKIKKYKSLWVVKNGTKNKKNLLLKSEHYVAYKKEVDLIREERERRFLG
jgi:hypothetical protein